jgi:hypothetical protein
VYRIGEEALAGGHFSHSLHAIDGRLGASSSKPDRSCSYIAGGCAGTVLTDALPPVWARGGWNQPAARWPVPWAFGTGNDTVAYVYATQLVAGTSPRVNGTNNKILWESKDLPSGAGVAIDAQPMGQTEPVVTLAGGPSIVDLPTAGCWTFQLSWSSNGKHTSTVNLEVLPTGTLP